MLYENPDESEYFLWRLMIAEPYQRMGFGREAVFLLVAYVQSSLEAKELLVSCVEGEGSPEGFYTSLGFRRTGAMRGDEVVLSLALGSS
jgi:diamine N-acetyltransferase